MLTGVITRKSWDSTQQYLQRIAIVVYIHCDFNSNTPLQSPEECEVGEDRGLQSCKERITLRPTLPRPKYLQNPLDKMVLPQPSGIKTFFFFNSHRRCSNLGRLAIANLCAHSVNMAHYYVVQEPILASIQWQSSSLIG